MNDDYDEEYDEKEEDRDAQFFEIINLFLQKQLNNFHLIFY